MSLTSDGKPKIGNPPNPSADFRLANKKLTPCELRQIRLGWVSIAIRHMHKYLIRPPSLLPLHSLWSGSIPYRSRTLLLAERALELSRNEPCHRPLQAPHLGASAGLT